MNPEAVERLVELLSNADETKRLLRLRFVDDEVYDLMGFAVCQDLGEEYPHCTAVVVYPVRAPEHKLKHLSSDVAMLFRLNEIIEVQGAVTKELLFKS